MKPKDVHTRLIERFGSVIDLRENPSILLDILEELGAMPQAEGGVKTSASPPFGVSWMDSWVAHWVYNEKLNTAKRQDIEVANVLQRLADLKFEERLAEIQRFIRDFPRLKANHRMADHPNQELLLLGLRGFLRAKLHQMAGRRRNLECLCRRNPGPLYRLFRHRLFRQRGLLRRTWVTIRGSCTGSSPSRRRCCWT